MKISIEIDCSPAEARAFFGLPDVEAVQASVLEAAQERLAEAVRTMDGETLLKTWFPAGMKGFEEWRKGLWPAPGAQRGDDEAKS